MIRSIFGIGIEVFGSGEKRVYLKGNFNFKWVVLLEKS